MTKLIKAYGRELGKKLAVFGLLCLLVSFGTVTVNAENAAKITVSSSTVDKDATASVGLLLEGNPGIWGLKLRIHYDHSALTLQSVTTGSVYSDDEIIMSEETGKDPFVILASCNGLENRTADGTVVTLNFTVNGNAELKAYPVTVEVAQANNAAGEEISIGAVEGSVTVVNCSHEEKEWRITTAAKCEEDGVETLTCKNCGATFETRAIPATGHQNTEIRNVAAATGTSEGYTGDTYCQDCGKLIKQGETIAKSADSASSETGETASSETGDVAGADTGDVNLTPVIILGICGMLFVAGAVTCYILKKRRG